ncbi:hypothetical protein HF086_014948 [Spodoptera exigua]|uniref:Uncharacterized protein n=1 Tax=Spodoptera exigua TaxID=7107 RepID=A0A922SH07_SPOEX|nr:hypothetical protein HF086_014948 [Spodoptera exigua]
MDPYKNITHRKLQKTGSLSNLTDITKDDEETLFDITMCSIPDSLLNQSDNDRINELNEQIKTLNMQLLSAHQEIDNLNNENFRLKTDLQKSLKTVETCKKICLTPNRKNTPPLSTRKKNSLHQNKISPNAPKIITTPQKKTKVLNNESQTIDLTTTAMHNKSTQTSPSKIKELTFRPQTKNTVNNNNKETITGITQSRQKK